MQAVYIRKVLVDSVIESDSYVRYDIVLASDMNIIKSFSNKKQAVNFMMMHNFDFLGYLPESRIYID